MGKVMNIYGVMVDDTGFGETIKKYRTVKPVTRNSELLEAWIRQLLSNCNDDFFLYIHKTKKENIYPIIYHGLKIYEEGGELESTMSRVFDSTSSDIEGDINYFLNEVNNGNQYGNCSIVAIIPKDYTETYELIHQTNQPTVPASIIAFGVNEYGYIVRGSAYSKGELIDSEKHYKNK